MAIDTVMGLREKKTTNQAHITLLQKHTLINKLNKQMWKIYTLEVAQLVENPHMVIPDKERLSL